MEAGAGLPMGERADGALPYGLPVRVRQLSRASCAYTSRLAQIGSWLWSGLRVP